MSGTQTSRRLFRLDRAVRGGRRHDYGRAAGQAFRDAGPRRPQAPGSAMPCRRSPTGCSSCRTPASRRSAPTATPTRRLPAARRRTAAPHVGRQPHQLSTPTPCRRRRQRASRASSPSSTRTAPAGRWCSSRCATRSAQAANRLAIVDEHDIVYRGAAGAGACSRAAALAETATWRRELVPDAVLLFRYSALTFNGHRIHYDRDYVTGSRGLSGAGRARAADRHAAARSRAPQRTRARAQAVLVPRPCRRCSMATDERQRDASRRRRPGPPMGRQCGATPP